MTQNDFIQWMNGFLDGNDEADGLTQLQLDVIRAKLDSVIKPELIRGENIFLSQASTLHDLSHQPSC